MAFRDEFNKIYETHNIEKIKSFLSDYLELSIKSHDTVGIIESLNEAIGFYRDIEDFYTSKNYATSLSNILKNVFLDPDAYFISYINIANSYRAFGDFKSAEEYFLLAEKIYVENNLNDTYELSALYNNLALMYQTYDSSRAIIYFNKALDIIKLLNDKLREGITYVNLGYTYLSVNDLSNVKKYIDLANTIFESLKDDFHYTSLLGLEAKYYNLVSEKEESVKYYKLALSHFDKFQGRSRTYRDLLDEYLNLGNEFPHLLDISYNLFNEFIKKVPNNLLDKIVVGLFGYGSECNYLDDIYSIDHDYVPGFIILYKDDLDIDSINKLNDLYNSLPEFYDIYYRRENKRLGVKKYSDYLESIGINNINDISNESLNLLTNGKIFYNGFIDFKNLREDALINFKLNIKLNIASNILLSNQTMYNIDREKIRKNILNVKYLYNNLVDYLVELYYLDNKIPLIHNKERLKLIKKNSKIYKFINKILNNKYNDIKEDLNLYLLKMLKKYDLIANISSFCIEDYRNEIIYNKELYSKKLELALNITNLEWQMHKVLPSADGIMECQINKNYYKIMRISQHINMTQEFLEQYNKYLIYATEKDINIPYIKYAFMEESTNVDMFNNVKNNLPKISEKRKALQETIVSLQLEMLLKFDKKNKCDTSLMRTFNTSSDSNYNASYETYLRAELSSLSEDLVVLYAKTILGYSKNKKNFVEYVVNTSKYLY